MSVINGVKRIGEVDPAIFGSIGELQKPDESGLELHFRPTTIDLLGRRRKVKKIVKPIFEMIGHRFIEWHVFHGQVMPNGQQIQSASRWHAHESAITFLVSSALPTEVVVAETNSGLSCERRDVELDTKGKYRGRLLVDCGSDTEAINELGLGVVSLVPGVLYGLSPEAMHRSPTNESSEPIERTMLGFTLY